MKPLPLPLPLPLPPLQTNWWAANLNLTPQEGYLQVVGHCSLTSEGHLDPIVGALPTLFEFGVLQKVQRRTNFWGIADTF